MPVNKYQRFMVFIKKKVVMIAPKIQNGRTYIGNLNGKVDEDKIPAIAKIIIPNKL